MGPIPQGILVGCDQTQEWLLPTWHSHLATHHPNLPIAFGDLGMTPKAQHWCARRGLLIPSSQIPALPTTTRNPGWPYARKTWIQKDLASTSHSAQSILFRKPLLMKQTPFHRTLYLDLDCQVLGDLSPLLSSKLGPSKMALRASNHMYEMKAVGSRRRMLIPSYNSGVIVYEKKSRLLDFWIFLLGRAMHSFNTDDRLLSFAIECYKMPVTHFGPRYNWLYHWGENPDAVVCHWIGEAGKVAFRLLGGNQPISTYSH